jgi:hypothetical protein
LFSSARFFAFIHSSSFLRSTGLRAGGEAGFAGCHLAPVAAALSYGLKPPPLDRVALSYGLKPPPRELFGA